MWRKTVIAIAGWIVTATVMAALMVGAWWLWRRLRTGPAIDWNAPDVSAILVGSLAVLLLAIWWLWWRLPKRQVRGLDIQIHDPKARADTEDNFRKTVGQALGGAAVLIGAGAAYLQFTQQQQAQQQATEISRKASTDLLISNQVSKGFEQLAGKEMAMRLGGLYALEGVMNTSEQYHQPVLEALCAFVRDNTVGKKVNETPATDIHAALTVIGRRTSGPGRVDLVGTQIPGANLSDANLISANLSGATLNDADLSRAILSGAILRGASLGGAHLNDADLSRTDLIDAHLDSADLNGARLSGAHLNDADLSRADLNDADLRAADLNDAHLFGADLSGADLRDANLSGADLSVARHLTQAQLDQACGTDAKLPPGLTLKPCSPYHQK